MREISPEGRNTIEDQSRGYYAVISIIKDSRQQGPRPVIQEGYAVNNPGQYEEEHQDHEGVDAYTCWYQVPSSLFLYILNVKN